MKEFRRNELLERLLRQLNADLLPAESRLVKKYLGCQMTFPLILVMGPLRSGTTLFLQWLANTGLVAYPTNLLSRFYRAPIIGAKVQLMLTDPRFNFRDELGEFPQQSNYESENGKTKGILAPNEFWYFWRRFLADESVDVWSDDDLRKTMDSSKMKAELVGLMDVFQAPFAAKGMLFNYNIPYLSDVLDKVVFVHLQREPVANVASILRARRAQSGSEADWYSFQIPEFDQLKALDPVSQVAGQVMYINRAVAKGLEEIDETQKLHVHYERFCDNPKAIFVELVQKVGLTTAAYDGPDRFEIPRAARMRNRAEIETKLRSFV